MKEETINEIWVVLLIALGILSFVSLVTYHSEDLALYTSSPNTPVKNFAGVIGAHLSGGLVFLVGRASYIIPLVILAWAFGIITKKTPRKLYIKFSGAVILVLATGSFFSLIAKGEETLKFLNGGLFGVGFSSFLVKYFGLGGSYIIITMLFLLSLLLTTDFLLFPFLQVLSKKARGMDVLGKTTQSVKEKIITFKAKRVAEPVKKISINKAVIAKKEEPTAAPKLAALISKPNNVPKIIILPPKPKAEPKPKLEPAKVVSPTQYKIPPLELLDLPPPVKERKLRDDLALNSKILEETLADFDLEVKVVKVDRGPVITRYELEPAPGLKISKISSLSDDIALAMKAISVRVVAPLPGKGTVGVEVPNSEGALVYLREALESDVFQKSDAKLAIALGKNIAGEPVVADLADMPHLLIAGTTGSGKTVCVNSLVASLLFRYTPDELKFIMVDPKMVELAAFNGLPHLLSPVVTDAKKVSGALNWVVNEMESRYELFAQSGSRNIDIYNQKAGEDKPKLPYLIVIIDELADLMAIAQNDIESAITRLAQLSRAVGIHIVLATQRPSVDVITGVIKANFPARISFKVASKVDSRTVLDMNGADKLLGRGDMLFIEPGVSKPIRAQGSLVSDAEITKIVDFIKSQRNPEYNEKILAEQKKAGFRQFEKDEVYEEAVRLVLQTKQASVSMLQRRLGLGYTRAARIIDMMEDEGIVGPYMGSKPRDILVEKIDDIRRSDE